MAKKVVLKKADKKIIFANRIEELQKLIEDAYNAGDDKAHLRWTMELQSLQK